MALGKRNDPYTAFNFHVELQGLVVAGFSEVSGLQGEVEVVEYREGGVNEYLHKFPGPLKYPSNLVLKRGIGDGDTLWSWFDETSRGQIKRRNGSILLLDSAGQPSVRWNFVDAYPVRWSGPELKADSSLIAIESLELVHRGLSRA